mmetsp:Transcript_26325/g.36700  ORF Transcript_26325/g.36700 Transcript_26325/m.36700 type:complete len:128 (+) Transcript_26325:306-689(+)
MIRFADCKSGRVNCQPPFPTFRVLMMHGFQSKCRITFNAFNGLKNLLTLITITTLSFVVDETMGKVRCRLEHFADKTAIIFSNRACRTRNFCCLVLTLDNKESVLGDGVKSFCYHRSHRSMLWSRHY